MEFKDLKQDKRNYRKHNERNLDLIKKSVEEVGLGRSIVIDNENNIVCGNGLTSTLDKNTKIKVVETDGTELVVVKRTDLATDDLRRKQLAIMDNSASDSSEFDIELMKEDFELEQLADWGLDELVNLNMADDEFYDEEELMDNDNLQEMQTNKMLALSKMPISKYLVLVFDENCDKQDFIANFAKKYNPQTDIDINTQYCTYAFMKKDMLND